MSSKFRGEEGYLKEAVQAAKPSSSLLGSDSNSLMGKRVKNGGSGKP